MHTSWRLKHLLLNDECVKEKQNLELHKNKAQHSQPSGAHLKQPLRDVYGSVCLRQNNWGQISDLMMQLNNLGNKNKPNPKPVNSKE